MHIKLSHSFTYTYSKPVQLGAHRLCLMPRTIGFQKLISHKISFNPEPWHKYELLAAGGDQILRAKFIGNTDRLEILSESEVVTSAPPLIELCLDEQEARLPYPIGKLNADLVSNLQGWLPNGQHDPAAIALAQEATIGSDQRCLSFLQQLHELIQERVNYTQRHNGPPGPPDAPCGNGWVPAAISPCC